MFQYVSTSPMISVRAWGSAGCWKGYSDGINLDLEGLIAVTPKRNGEPSSTYHRCHFAVSSPVSFFELFFLCLSGFGSYVGHGRAPIEGLSDELLLGRVCYSQWLPVGSTWIQMMARFGTCWISMHFHASPIFRHLFLAFPTSLP